MFKVSVKSSIHAVEHCIDPYLGKLRSLPETQGLKGCHILVSAMPNIVIQQIKIANYQNIFLMLIKSNCRLRITNAPSEK